MEKNNKRRNFLIFLNFFSFVLISSIFLKKEFFILGNMIRYNFLSNILIPSAITSLFLSFFGIFFSLFMIFEIKKKGVTNIFPIRATILSVFILSLILGINYYVTFFPYGNLLFTVISLFLQFIVYGILIPYNILSIIIYSFFIVTARSDKIKW